MHTVFKFNRAIVINNSKCNLAERFDLKKLIQVLFHKNNVLFYILFVKILMKLKKDTSYVVQAHSIYYAR